MRIQSILLTCFALALTTYALPAGADVAPPDACTQGPGAACSNAGPNYDQPGICTTESCDRPGPDGSTAYSCILCELADAAPSTDASAAVDANAGEAGVSTEDSGAPPAHDAGATPPPAGGSSSSGGCMYSAGTTKGLTGFTMFLVGIAALALGRRRRA